MRTPLAPWTQRLHDHCHRLGVGITPTEATAMFGPPTGNSTAASILASATRSGWFRREDGRYYALTRTESQLRTPDTRTSWFAGLKRVNSVWQLGGKE